MQIRIEYSTQVRVASGNSSEQVDVADGSTVADLLKQLVEFRAAAFSPWLSENGQPRPGLLVFVNDQSPGDLSSTRLRAGDQVALMTLVSGG